MKRLPVFFLTLLLAIQTPVQCAYSFSESKSNVDAALARVKASYHIQKQDDYVVDAVSKATVFDDKKKYSCCCDYEDYNLLGLILQKKPVVWIECPEYLGDNKDINFLLKQKDIRCAYIKHKQGSMYLMYGIEGRHKALALIKSALNLANKGHRISQHPDDITFEYLAGICLGYALDDIDFYFERIAFHNIKGFWPETEEQFEQFLANEWIDSQECTDLEQAALKATSWLDEHSNVTLLQQDIDSYQKNNKNIDIKYDVPYASFVRYASIKRKVTGVFHSAIANILTLGGLIPCL